ncbi:MAG: class I SAM-dependent methyltransferase [Pyrinomonadaceae bacterium MAG19_C2-C3]|nr:class I SAM-dependent methyltransferase [Pyrinomonadaceae bacterium MAG19_C2-C3]
MPHEETSHYYEPLVAAFVRGRLKLDQDKLTTLELIRIGLASGLRLHKFKRNIELPRVRSVLGTLRGLSPQNLMDIGSGRGTFLWALLDAFPQLTVTALDRSERRAADIAAVRRGGIENLSSVLMDACTLGFADKCVDVVTLLEVIEHLERPNQAAAEAVRVARRFVIVSVPSKEDTNPEHIQLFDGKSLEHTFLDVGARSVKVGYVPNHIIALVKV